MSVLVLGAGAACNAGASPTSDIVYAGQSDFGDSSSRALVIDGTTGSTTSDIQSGYALDIESGGWRDTGWTWSWGGGSAGWGVGSPTETWDSHQIYLDGYGYGQIEYTWV